MFLEEFKKVPETSKNIRKANEDTRELLRTLGNSKAVAEQALKFAQDAQKEAEAFAEVGSINLKFHLKNYFRKLNNF